jgi:hypothetical protein
MNNRSPDRFDLDELLQSPQVAAASVGLPRSRRAQQSGLAPPLTSCAKTSLTVTSSRAKAAFLEVSVP